MLQLEVISGKNIGKNARFNRRIVRVGTACDNDFQIEDDLADAIHGAFLTRPGHDSFYYRDLQSMHGTRIHTSRVDVVLLDHHNPQAIMLSRDVLIHVGRSVLRCVCTPDEPLDKLDDIHSIESCSMRALQIPTDQADIASLLESLREVSLQNSIHSVYSQYVDMVFRTLGHVDRGTIWHCDSEYRIFSCLYERTTKAFHGQASFGLTQLRYAIKHQEATIFEVNRFDDQSIEPSTVMIVPICEDQFENAVAVFESTHCFTHREFEWVTLFTKNAAASASRMILNADLSDVLDGFIRATISALDTRDPATAGHSMRVANYVLMTALAIHSQTTGPFAQTTFTRDEIDELRYAALLHDIGKVAIREEIILKSGRLLPRDFQLLQERLDLFSAWFEDKTPEALGDAWRSPQQFARYREIVTRLQRADNKLREDDLACLNEMRKTFIPTRPGKPLLTAMEQRNLEIRRGTLNDDERRDIQQHVLVSWRYLSKILWPRRWSRVPAFVLQHHEHLNGTGYPYGLSGDAIFLQSRILTICDIFDALTGGDRPYKQRHSFSEAAEILLREVDEGALDSDITQLFIEQIMPHICDIDVGTYGFPNIDFATSKMPV